MTDIENWLARYEESYRQQKSPALYWASVSMLIIGVTGLLWALPVPDEFAEISPLLNWGSTFLMVAAIYYFIISLALAIGLLPFLLGLAVFQVWLASSSLPAGDIATALLVAGLAGLLLCRGGALLRVVDDLQLMMLAPPWILSRLFQYFGIPV